MNRKMWAKRSTHEPVRSAKDDAVADYRDKTPEMQERYFDTGNDSKRHRNGDQPDTDSNEESNTRR